MKGFDTQFKDFPDYIDLSYFYKTTGYNETYWNHGNSLDF